jgi:hypothetical protein
MRIGRAVIIPVILALSAAGSILSVAAVPATTVAAPSAHVQVVAAGARPDMLYRG